MHRHTLATMDQARRYLRAHGFRQIQGDTWHRSTRRGAWIAITTITCCGVHAAWWVR